MSNRAPGSIRPAQPSDIPEIGQLIRELAAYEREPQAAIATDEQLHDALFVGATTPAGSPAAYCLVVEAGSDPETSPEPSETSATSQPPEPPKLAGLALYFLNFSTWTGRHGIYLEDLFVRDEYRGAGYGKALLSALAAGCVERGYGRLEWWVLDWNTPAWDFYRSQGAEPMTEWTTHRVTGPALRALAEGS